jgi:hypothetical protein
MPVLARSLVNYPQTISGQTIPAMGQRTYGALTSALTTAVNNGTIKAQEYVDPQAASIYAGQKVQYATPLTGETHTVDDDADVVVMQPAGTIAALTLNMPASPFDGQEVAFASTQVITALTMSGNGKTLLGALTAGSANGFAKWRYRAATTTWYRVG